MWTTPHDWTNETVTATLMNLVRDNLRFLYNPPECRVAGLSEQKPSFTDAGFLTWVQIAFPNTVVDNDQMRTLTGIQENEQAEALIETQTAGHYLAAGVVGFDRDTDSSIAPHMGISQLVAVCVRSSYTAAASYVGGAIDGPGGGSRPTSIPVAAAYNCAAGYQWFLNLFTTSSSGPMSILRSGTIPIFNVTWIGG